MAAAPKPPDTSPSARRKPARGSLGLFRWIGSITGSREIEKRVDENFPSWQDFSEEKIRAAEEQRDERALSLPPHNVYVSSPLGKNFLYLMLISSALALGLSVPEQAPYLIYGAIVLVALIAIFVIFRDGMFFHLEGRRLRADGDMINKHTKGPGVDQDGEQSTGFLSSFSRKNKPVFRSKLLQIHYQNILRTFEQGNRRAWVNQDASLSDIDTLLSQRGLKLVWTLIEVLPQMGLIGTLIGLSTMFFAFRSSAELPEVSIISGFGTALGTTILANLFVLILRPLHMQNERSAAEILSNLQMLMAMFILPTQQDVFDRGQPAAPRQAGATYTPMRTDFNEARLSHSMEELSHSLANFADVQQDLDTGNMAKETSLVAQEIRTILGNFGEAMQNQQVVQPAETSTQLAHAMHELSESMNQIRINGGQNGGVSSDRIEHDLAQMRLLTHDTLLLLEQIASQMGRLTSDKPDLLSRKESLRKMMLERQAAPERQAPPPPEPGNGPVADSPSYERPLAEPAEAPAEPPNGARTESAPGVESALENPPREPAMPPPESAMAPPENPPQEPAMPRSDGDPVEAAEDEASTDSADADNAATDSAATEGAVPDESAGVENSTEPDEPAHAPLSADEAADAATGGSPEEPALEDKPDSAGTLPKIRLFDEYR